jgi:hypothetical protein
MINVNKVYFVPKQLCQNSTLSKPCWALRLTKANLIFTNSLSLHFIAATIEIQHDLGDNWQMNVNKDFILYQNNCHYFPPFKTLLSAKIDKAKFWFCKFFEFAFIAIGTNMFRNNWLLKVNKDFILYDWKQSEFHTPKTLLSAKIDKAKFWFLQILWVCIYSRHHWDTTWFRDNWQIMLTRTLFCTKQLCHYFPPENTGAKEWQNKNFDLQILWVLHL